MGKKRRDSPAKTKEYVLHLMAELASFVLDAEPERMVVSLHSEPDGIHLSVLDSVPRGESEIDKIRRALNQQSRPELADYYGHMAGVDLIGRARLGLVGWQVKGAEVSSSESGTKIDIWLGNDHFDPRMG